MITCPNCHAQNLPGMAYCENCGSPLPQDVAAAAPAAPQDATTAPPAAATAAPSSGPIIIDQPDPASVALPQPVMPVDQPPSGPDMGVPAPVSGANAVAADAPAAPPDVAPAPDADQGTAAPEAAVPQPQPAAPAATGAGQLTITFPSGQNFTMQGDEVNVGRADVAQNWHPELDVIPYGGGAPDLGVSRHQARILRQDGGFVVVDVGSTNGTYINGRAAPYNQPAPLNDGDTLSFGALNTQISIK